MPCFVGIFALLMPRVVLLCIWLFSGYLNSAFKSIIWPMLGFLFMPLTTLAYAYAINTIGSVRGFYFILVLVAALIDLGLLGQGKLSRRRRVQ
jgi:hypothetical protein